MKRGFIYTEEYLRFDYGPEHPFKIIRLKLAADLSGELGLLSLPSVEIIPTRRATEEELALFHTPDYIEVLKQADGGALPGPAYAYGLGPGDNPIFKGVYDWSLLVAGGTIQAVDFVGDGRDGRVFHMAGGLHHAMASRASGFCYVNDAVIGITKLVKEGKRVAYLDFDAHHGDGVQKAFYETDRVLTLSFHETGHTLFPGTGFEHEIGEGEGEGYSVNLPFPPYTDDEIYLWAFEEIVPPVLEAYRPDVVVTQLGVDSFFNDPLARLNMTLRGFEQLVKRLRDLLPCWVALGGGGYDVSNVARAWTLVWAVMNGVDLGEALPERYLAEAARHGIHDRTLRGEGRPPLYSKREDVRKETERIVNALKRTVLPKISG
jgi:acetoin utilization protein AcuC